MVKKITGLLALPRISRNGNFYYPEELAKADGKTVPLRWNHIQDNEGIIGTAKLSYDQDKMQINYEATVDNEGVEQQLVNKEFKVSLGAEPQKEEKICHDEGKCYNVPLGLDFKEMSIVETPGIPEATLDVIEYFTTESVKFEDCECENTSNNTSNKEISMAEETETKVTVDTKEVPAKEAPQQCPEGQALKDGKCVPEAPAPEAPKAPEAAAPVAQVPEPVHTEHKEADCGCSKEAEKTNVETEVNAKVEAKLESIQDEIRENYAPKATVEENTTPKGYVEEGVEEQTEELKKVLKGNSVVIEIDKEDFYKAHTVKENSPVTEAVSTSGTIPTVSAQRDIIVLPGGISVKPVRQWTQFKEIPQGNDKVRFYKIDIPAFADITEGGSDISASTHTLTSIDVAADTPRGFRQVVKKTEIEKYPSGLLEAIRSTARLRAIQDEASIILKDIAAPAAAASGYNTFVAGKHLRADTGANVGSTSDEDAAGEFLKEGVEFGRQKLEEAGFDVSPGNVVLAITPRAFRTLISDPDIATYVQNGDPAISQQGRLERYLGVDLFVTNTLRTANNSYRNVMWVKGKAFAVASGRKLELEFDKNIDNQSVSVVATHRTNAGILDQNAYVILSSKQD
tara:strand:- start:3396 stop:5273 length:1878 start_codon:yes stop_codon:yes gene_type:complete